MYKGCPIEKTKTDVNVIKVAHSSFWHPLCLEIHSWSMFINGWFLCIKLFGEFSDCDSMILRYIFANLTLSRAKCPSLQIFSWRRMYQVRNFGNLRFTIHFNITHTPRLDRRFTHESKFHAILLYQTYFSEHIQTIKKYCNINNYEMYWRHVKLIDCTYDYGYN